MGGGRLIRRLIAIAWAAFAMDRHDEVSGDPPLLTRQSVLADLRSDYEWKYAAKRSRKMRNVLVPTKQTAVNAIIPGCAWLDSKSCG